LIGGAGASGRPALAPSEYAAAQPTEAVARLLAIADREAMRPRPDRKRLAAVLRALDGLGARPADGAVDRLAGWRRTAGATREPPMRGRVLGPAYRNGQLSPGSSVRLAQLFDGGRAARVAVAAPGKGTLDFLVLDADNKPVCPPAIVGTQQCQWTPLYSGRYEIVLVNRGSQSAGYYLVID
jgi:hypothetical protein